MMIGGRGRLVVRVILLFFFAPLVFLFAHADTLHRRRHCCGPVVTGCECVHVNVSTVGATACASLSVETGAKQFYYGSLCKGIARAFRWIFVFPPPFPSVRQALSTFSCLSEECVAVHSRIL